MKKRFAALFLAAVMLLALGACTVEKGTKTTANTDSLTKEDVIEVMVISHPSWPVRDDWKIWDYIAEGTGATIDITSIPNTDMSTKYSLMFAAPDTLPDIATFDNKPASDSFAQMGALVAFDDMAEYMPNYNAWADSLSEEEKAALVFTRKGADGKVYYTPVKGRERSQNVRAWIYRKDIFEKHNLAVPTTFDELYEVCKVLKELYPDSFPLCIRQSLTNLDVTGPSWKPYWTTGIYYDYTTEKFCYGAIEDTMADVLAFYKKMLDEKLVPADFLTINTTSWQELVITDRGFIMPEYQTRIDFFNGMARQENPSFKLAAMKPPVANAETGVAMVNKYNVDPAGFVMCNTRDDARIANAAKYTDWFYSDEAEELVGWGKEGETYNVIDGKKVFITDESKSQPNTLFGISTYGVFTRIDPTAVEAMETEDIAKTRDEVLSYTLPYSNPTGFLAFNEEEQKVKDVLGIEISMFVSEKISKFLLGQEPLSGFDKFVEDVKGMDVDKLLDAYTSAYERVK